MPISVAEIVLSIIVAVIGAATGWLLRGGGAQRKSGKSSSEIRYTREVLGRLHELAAHVAADVGEHTSRVEEINEELLSTAAHETEAVVSAVDRLLEANNRMQKQLASADEKLQEQARQIVSHAAEARTDALTGLANRRAFDDAMIQGFAEFKRHHRTFSVTMIDVDHFKRFNDTHGHQAGDAVLAGLAGVLRNNARSTDLVARYGGEEFAVILSGTSVSAACSAAERLRAAIESTPFNYQGADLHVTVSLGVAEVLAEENVFEHIRRADAALYASKRAGRNCVCSHDGREIRRLGGRQEVPSKQARSESAKVQPTPRQSQSSAGQPSQDRPAATPAEAGPAASPGPPDGDDDRPCSRAAFEASLGRRLEQCRGGGSPPSVLLVRLDQHRMITAKYGKQAGELVLRTAMRLLRSVAGNMDLLARYDLATFAVLFPGANLAATVGMAERLREAVAGCTLAVARDQLRFTVSMSAAAAMDDDDDTSALLRRAEEALDAAFKSGGDCSYFHNGQWSEMAQATPQGTPE